MRSIGDESRGETPRSARPVTQTPAHARSVSTRINWRRSLIGGLMVVFAAIGLFGSAVRAQDDDGANTDTDTDVGTEADAELGTVDVLQVSALLDPLVADEIEATIDRAVDEGSQAVVLQVNTKGAVIGRTAMTDLLERVATADVPVAVWVGPSGARLYGMPAQLLAVADVTGMAPGARVGHTGPALHPPSGDVDFGAATETLEDGSLGLSDARALNVFKQRISDEGVPTLTSMVHALDGYEENGVTLETTEESVTDDATPVRDTTAVVRLFKLNLIDQIFHTVASPAVTYLLLLLGLGLLVFEFYTAGVGIAGVIGAASLFLACTGLATLPARGWAVGLIIAATVAFAIDVQVGIPRFWTGVGLVLTVIGSWFLFESLPGATLRPSWITLIAGIGGTMLAYIVGMPSMVRTRFATPTIGREWMIDRIGTVAKAVDPEGIVTVDDAQWRARTNRATPVGFGEHVRVVAIDGVTLEVEPMEGAAQDYREKRRNRSK